ncbi:ABC transporter ATP-binding protein [Angustibacter sp. McL0619]|uniref:ABC transporter ATP-binding protein n=1 Tax=Angustibacter sp. McL0619 TaxID=3415676 RepID=UPI003CED3D17
MTAGKLEPAQGPAVEVTNLRKVYPVREGGRRSDFVAVDDVSFTLEAGGSLAIVGESGSGKTTLAKMLVGLERPTAGKIEILGVDRSAPERGAKARRRRGRDIQIVFQDPYTSLDRRQTVGDALAEVLRLHSERTRSQVADRVVELAELVGLDARQVSALPSALSGGQRQRVAIARALAAEPTVLILDESVAALDVSIQAQILNLLADIRERSAISYLLISHDLAVVRQVTDDVIVMRRGEVVERGRTAEVLDHPTEPYTRLLRDSVPGPGWDPHRAASLSTTDSPV